MPRLRKGLLEEKAMVWRLGEGCLSVAGGQRLGMLACKVSGEGCMYGVDVCVRMLGARTRVGDGREDETGGGRVCLPCPCRAMRGGCVNRVDGWVLRCVPGAVPPAASAMIIIDALSSCSERNQTSRA